MPSILTHLVLKGLSQIQSGWDQLIQYEVIMGSLAYGVSNDSSDYDVYSFLCPPKEYVFPHQIGGEIEGFGPKRQRFEVYQQHHMFDQTALGGKGRTYDYSAYNIVKYFDLAMGNNPNIIDALFVPERCILFMTPLGQRVREKRRIFLSKKMYHTCKGYSFSQLHKMRIKEPGMSSKRRESFDKHGFDVKYGYQLVRLLNQCQQVLEEGDLDLELSREQLKSIRRGEWKLEEIENYFKEKEQMLERLYESSKLPSTPRYLEIKALLLECLDLYYGDLSKIVVNQDKNQKILDEIRRLVK